MDMSKTIAPKSDQLNADDLIGGPRTITVTGVRGNDNADQPVSINFEGDKGKPYKPCKSMRRVLVHCWGKYATEYVGRSMTLYCDPKVQFGGMAVGGIRISHMSHIDGKREMALTATRGKRAPFVVQPLQNAPQTQTRSFDAELATLKTATTMEALEAAWGQIGPDARKALSSQLGALKAALPQPQQDQQPADDVGFNDDSNQGASHGGYEGA